MSADSAAIAALKRVLRHNNEASEALKAEADSLTARAQAALAEAEDCQRQAQECAAAVRTLVGAAQ
jgi:hypothetical protein